MTQMNFDASQVQPNSGVQDAIPAGWYKVIIDESEMKPTKDGTGSYLQLRFSVMEGQYANRKVYVRLNIRNSNPVAQEIAYGDLSAICHATGIMHLQDSQQLHNIPLNIKVKVRPANDEYEASNDVSSYKNINDPSCVNAAVAGGAVQQQPAQQQGWQQPAQQAAPVQQQPAQQAAPVQQTWDQPAQQAAPVQQQAAPQTAQQPAQQPAQQQPAAQPWEQPAQQQQQQQPAQQQAAPQTTAAAPAAGGNGMPPWANGG